MNDVNKVWTKAEKTGKKEVKLSRVIEFDSGNQIAIPIHKDGSIKWFDDSKLIKR